VTHPMMSAIDLLCINSVQLAHSGGEIGLGRFYNHMIVVGHLALGVDDPVKSFATLGQHFQPRYAVGIVNVDVLAPVAARRDVVQSAGEFEAKGA